MSKKNHPFDNDEMLEQVVAHLAALADPTRLRILNHLRTTGECTVGALVEVVGLSQPSVSRHLAILKREGLIHARRDGNQLFCSVRDESVFSICSILCDCVSTRVKRDHSALRGRRPVKSKMAKSSPPKRSKRA